MSYGLSKLKIKRLLSEIGDTDERRLAEQPAAQAGVTAGEQDFMEQLVRRRPDAKAYRAGWPDFLVQEDGKTYGVEVKCGIDDIRDSQRVMFDALERCGIPVYIWHDSAPDKLTPWRSFRKHGERLGRPEYRTDRAPSGATVLRRRRRVKKNPSKETS